MLENLSWKAAVLGCVCAYVVTSKILFEHPEYLHESAKKRHQHHNYRMSDRHSFHISTIDASAKFHYQLVAHRGSRLEGLPENTIAAFRDASSGGASIVELDVWLSKDGKVVVHHDESLDRMTKGENKSFVHELQHEDFPKLVPGENQCERCHLFDDHECHRVPLLRDVIHQIPTSVAIVIEFKQNSYELIKKVHDIILDQGPKRVANVFWFSLQEPINKKLHDFDPTLSSITSITRMLLIFVYYYLGLLPFIPIQEDVFGITMEEITLERVRHEKALSWMPSWLHPWVHRLLAGKPPAFFCAPALFRHLRKRGIPTWFMGVNSIEDIHAAVQYDASAILTDRIHFVRKYMDENHIRFKGLDL